MNANSLRESNPRTNVVINLSKEVLSQGNFFLRMHIYLQALKMGYKKGPRPIVLDSIFLKGKAKGQLLVVVRKNNMNYFYPLAWAIVNRKKKKLNLISGAASLLTRLEDG